MNTKLVPRRFVLVRTEDVHGVSGEGIICEGVQFTTGYVVFTWLSPFMKIDISHSADVMEHVHGHEGKTRVVWLDPHEGRMDLDALVKAALAYDAAKQEVTTT
jgi:hypothetical protein